MQTSLTEGLSLEELNTLTAPVDEFFLFFALFQAVAKLGADAAKSSLHTLTQPMLSATFVAGHLN